MIGREWQRILAIHATSRGFAYVIMEGPGELIDFGIKHVRRGEKNHECLRLLEHLITRFDPHLVVIEDTEDTRSKRSSRVKHLYRQLEKLADRAGIDTYCYPWPTVFEVFKDGTPKTRHDIAVMIAVILPALKRRVPPKRKDWLPMDPRQALLDAAALSITHYAVNG